MDLRDSGVTAAHLPDGIHPGAEGMDLITEAVIDLLLDLEAPEIGENVVHSVTHKLTGATASLGYFKGVTHGAAFSETLSGDGLMVTVTMGGADITADCYADGKITIDRVTGELVITAAGRFDADGHLQQLPEKLCRGTNLWSVLTPDKQYYTVSGWGVHSSGKVYSITFPVSQGDQIYANSFGSGSVNGSGGTNGIRVTYFLEDGTVRSLPTNTVYSEFAANGYLTAPAGAIAVCVPMWTVSSSNTVRLLNAHHTYVNGVCTACSDASLPLEEVSGGLFRLTGSYADLSADLEIPAGTTLDLNGFDLNVAALVSFGQVIDSRGGGLLAAETFLPGAADNYLPIFDTSAGGYRFYAYTCKTLGVRATGDTAVFGFALNFADPAAYTLLTQTQKSGLSIHTKLSCGETDLSFVFSPELLRQYAQLCLDHPTLTAALLLTVTGMDVIPSGETVTAATFLTCADGQHSASFKIATYTKP